MTPNVLHAVGGLGLFLLGMLVLTEGLRGLVGEVLARGLQRFTRSPWSGAALGAGVTALVQSSSLTTVMTVGFVSAGLMTFSQALGVLFGANLGTTVTGWLVALLGLQLKIGDFVAPLLLLGVMLRLFGRRRLAHVGQALAGFALVFMGLDGLQQGLIGFQGYVTPQSFAPDTWAGRLQLVGIGIVVTLVTQSSSAGVAMSLAALAAGTVSFPQAAALVIGMDVGTTATAALATLGGSAQTRRTGYAHVVFNVLTGTVAFFLLDVYAGLLDHFAPGALRTHATFALVGFHSLFNALGVLAILPFTGAFARLMETIVPERGPDLVARLDAKLLVDPGAATLALLGTVRAVARELFDVLLLRMLRRAGTDGESDDLLRLGALDDALRAARGYADRLGAAALPEDARRRHLASIHVLDHLDRMAERSAQSERLAALRGDARLRSLARPLRAGLREARDRLGEANGRVTGAQLMQARDLVRGEREPYRQQVLEESSRGGSRVELAFRRMDAIRWLQRTAYHAWRIVHHLEQVDAPAQDA